MVISSNGVLGPSVQVLGIITDCKSVFELHGSFERVGDCKSRPALDQYHLKDHLGNVRTTFTTAHIVDIATATLEDANLAAEQSKFLRINDAKRVYAAIFDHTNGTLPGYAERLNGSVNEKFGVARSLSVMPGDTLQMQVYAKYLDTNQGNWTGALTTLVGQIAANTAGVVVDGAAYGSSTSSFPWSGVLTTSNSTGGPKAYLNWLIFDRNYIFVDGGFKQISTLAKEAGSDVAHELLSSGNITIKQAGYVYIYLSNEETTPVEVYFDDLKVTQTKSPVVQMDDYYPFGLTFNEYQKEGSLENEYLFIGKERQDELNIGWLDFGARMYQPEIARWNGIDKSSENYTNQSPYHYAGNNPIIFTDYNGNDYGVSVNHDARTITIQAHFITNSANAAAFNSQGRDKWNAQSGRSRFINGSIRELKNGLAQAYRININVTPSWSGFARERWPGFLILGQVEGTMKFEDGFVIRDNFQSGSLLNQ